MRYSHIRKMVAVLFTLWCGAALVGCGGGGDGEETKGNGGKKRPTTTANAGAVKVTIQMTGLLLMVPPKVKGEPTHVLAPQMPNHFNLLGFKHAQNTPGLCEFYNDVRDICYFKMNGWMLDSVGAATPTEAAPLSRRILNLSELSGAQVNLPAAIGNSLSVVRLFAGIAGNFCSLASWRVDPVGDPPQEALELVNRLDWTIPAVPGPRVQLIFKRMSDGNRAVLELTPTGNNLELLLLHVPVTDTGGLFSPPLMPAFTDDVRPHIDAYHTLLMGGDRQYPESPAELHPVCPVTVLGLEGDTSGGENRGIRTQSCITASATAG